MIKKGAMNLRIRQQKVFKLKHKEEKGGGGKSQNQASKSSGITSNSLTYVSLESQKEKGMVRKDYSKR